jgi:hypothetical protein
MLLHWRGKLMIAKSKSSRLSYIEVVSLPLESILSKIQNSEVNNVYLDMKQICQILWCPLFVASGQNTGTYLSIRKKKQTKLRSHTIKMRQGLLLVGTWSCPELARDLSVFVMSGVVSLCQDFFYSFQWINLRQHTISISYNNQPRSIKKIRESVICFYGNVDQKNLPARWRLTKIQFGMALYVIKLSKRPRVPSIGLNFAALYP